MALHCVQLSESEIRHSASVDELQRKIAELQLKTTEQQRQLEESVSKHQQYVDKIYDDRLQLEVSHLQSAY